MYKLRNSLQKWALILTLSLTIHGNSWGSKYQPLKILSMSCPWQQMTRATKAKLKAELI